MSYRVKIPRHVYRTIARLPGHFRQRVRRLINSLADNPRPAEAKHLRHHPDVWRYRLDRWVAVPRTISVFTCAVARARASAVTAVWVSLASA